MTHAELLHESAGTVANGYELHHTYRLPECGQVVRVRVRRHFYMHESYAVAEALTAGMEWTELVRSHPEQWRAGTPSTKLARPEYTTETVLHPVVSSLLEYARAVVLAWTRTT